MLGTPLQCSLLITRQQNILASSNQTHAAYLFHGDCLDLGLGSIGCGRRGDALKFFLSWKYYGSAVCN
jgi:glutamate decarboxylase